MMALYRWPRPPEPGFRARRLCSRPGGGLYLARTKPSCLRLLFSPERSATEETRIPWNVKGFATRFPSRPHARLIRYSLALRRSGVRIPSSPP